MLSGLALPIAIKVCIPSLLLLSKGASNIHLINLSYTNLIFDTWNLKIWV